MASKPARRLVPLLIVLIVAVVIGGSLFLRSRSSADPAAVRFETSLPGAARAPSGYVSADGAALDRLAAQSRALLLRDAGWIRSLRLEGRQSGQPAEPANVLDADDQIAAARVALESGDRAALQTALARIRRVFRNEQGLLAGTATLDQAGLPQRSAGFSTAASLGWLRLLAESSQMMNMPELLPDLRSGSDAFLVMTGADGLVPADRTMALLKSPPPPDPEATPTPRPSVAPTPEVESVRPVIRLTDLDLYAMKLLQPLDPRWQAVYERSLSLVREAILDGPVPLFQYAYDPAAGSYIGFAGSQPLIGLEDALETLLHLYEAGEPLPDSLTWVRSRFYESTALPEWIHRASGASASETECIAGYAMLARLARLAEDPLLYKRAVDRLAWHTATSTRSAAYGMIFRTDPDDRIRVTAHDNLWTLLAGR